MTDRNVIPDRIITKAIAAGRLGSVDHIDRRMADALAAVLDDLAALPKANRPPKAPDDAYRDYFEAQAKGMLSK